jgi:hypothetical protein
MEDREMKQRERKARFWLIPVVLGVFVLGGLLGAAATASAQDVGTSVAVAGSRCMQRVFIGNDATQVSSSNLLNCTAKDIKISRALENTITPASCDPNAGPFTLNVDFEVDVTSSERYDAGFFFRTDGGTNARGDGPTATGTCKLFGVDPNDPPGLNNDGDTCGDLNQTVAPNLAIIHFTIPGVTCVAAPGTNPPVLRLPYCTSWHSNARTACAIGQAFDFHPDTKSKCNCDDGFTVPVIVQSPSGDVLKTAVSALVTYEVTVKNTGPASTLTALDDNVYDDITKTKTSPAPDTNAKIEETTCAVPQSLAATTGSYTCQFKVLYNNPGTPSTGVANTVTATLTRTGADPTDVTGSTTINIDLGPDNTE